ncbi:MAG: acyltransferase [Halioglobus sp.]
MATPYPVPSRFFSLDVLRGTLTFFIIFFHWQHFFYDGGTVSADFVRTSQPLYAILTPLYTQGIYAVDFFFSLSGFIFFWLYAEPIRCRTVSASKYAALRFSRLYPLHIATLLLVIVAQHFTFREFGQYLVYQENDWYHLFLNIFFVNAWGVENGFSFNGPAWTVSIEVMMYISFFTIAYYGKGSSLLVALTIAIIGFFIERDFNKQIGMGFHSFFVGGIAYILYTKLLRFNLKRLVLILGPLCAIIWIVAIIDMYTGIAPGLKYIPRDSVFHRIFKVFDSSLFATIVVIPFTIIFLALAETVRGRLGKRAHVLGDLSYALYLLHFPLQLAFILVTHWLGIDRSFFYSVTSLLSFFVILFVLSYFSYFHFELPLQKYLRRRLIKRPS